MSSAVNPSVDAPEFISFRASEIVSSDWWRVGVGDTSPSSRSSRERRFSSFEADCFYHSENLRVYKGEI